jgi:hypothetical protein
MPYNINLAPIQSYSISSENGLAFIDWSFDPEVFRIDYLQGSANLSSVDVATIIKDYLALDTSGDTYHITDILFVATSSVNTLPIIISGEIMSAITADPVLGYEITNINLEVTTTVSFQDLGLLPEGLHSYNINFLVQRKNFLGELYFVAIKTLVVHINVVSPGTVVIGSPALTFAHIIGEALPAAQTIEIQASGSFSISVNDANYFYSGGNLVDVGLDPSGSIRNYTGSGSQTILINLKSGIDNLEVGVHTNFIKLTGPNNIKFRPIFLYIFSENSANIIPEGLEFMAIKNVEEAEPQNIQITCPGAISVSGPLWLTIFDANGDFANTSIIKPVLSNNLSAGVYEGFISVNANGIVYPVPVTYTITDNVSTGFIEDGINFTDDYNTISDFYNQQEFKVSLQLDVFSYNYESLFPDLTNLTYALGLFNNRADFFIGRSLNNIMAELEDLQSINLGNLENFLPDDASNFVRTYYKPAQLDFRVEFVHQNDANLNEEFIYRNILFIKGRKPLKTFRNTAILNYHLEPLRVTPKSIALLNYYKTENHEVRIYRNGELELTFGQFVFSDTLFARRLLFNNYTPGDVIEARIYRDLETDVSAIFYENEANYISQKYIVFPEGKQSYHIGWEDEYGCLDLMEFTGDIAFEMGYESNVIKGYKRFKEYLRKIDSRRSQDLSINTGFVLKENPKRLDSLVNSERAWLFSGSEDGIPLVPFTKGLPNYDSDRELYSYEIEFKINLNNDNKINS